MSDFDLKNRSFFFTKKNLFVCFIWPHKLGSSKEIIKSENHSTKVLCPPKAVKLTIFKIGFLNTTWSGHTTVVPQSIRDLKKSRAMMTNGQKLPVHSGHSEIVKRSGR